MFSFNTEEKRYLYSAKDYSPYAGELTANETFRRDSDSLASFIGTHDFGKTTTPEPIFKKKFEIHHQTPTPDPFLHKSFVNKGLLDVLLELEKF